MRKLAIILALFLCPLFALAQCDTTKADPVCNLPAFRQAFASAKYVRYNADKLDPIASKQLRDMLTASGKQLASDNDHPSLVFTLTQPDLNGIFVGPSGVVLARLRVYSPNHTLLWEETYTDQPDVPWPSAVLYLLQSLRTRLAN